ncbi:hypothetical protein HO173_006815 [Letharia columbiana]|uniref:HMG box domain-containing protein n=1 Tax=Letharia columbiana TaxID=112416 RepID=A0A8H6FUC8_9LECA|nr:uncharacterized protein HO173_006815 [Letharia columbiana]KAF6234885.1 hypothetical protein HO173_006815 [Letharia columbiana]
MARPKKAEEKPKDSGSLQISVEDFVRTRNSVVTGLATLQSAVSDLSRAYIAHTDTVIGRGNASSLEQLNISNPLSGENGLFGGRGPTPAPTTEAPPEGKKRKRAPHDKNAPKRALTPFFLYLQTARPALATEMGSGHTAKEVQDEGGRRWREMTDKDKSEWQYRYAVNFARYRAQTDAYKAGKPIPEISDAEAKKLYETTKKDGKILAPADLDPGHIDEEDESDSSTTSDEDSPEPVKAPSPKRKKTAKNSVEKKPPSAKQTPAKAPEPAVAEPTSQSPEKTSLEKKKKASKKKETKGTGDMTDSKKEVVAEPASSPSKLTGQDSQQKQQKKKGRKRKSEPAET